MQKAFWKKELDDAFLEHSSWHEKKLQREKAEEKEKWPRFLKGDFKSDVCMNDISKHFNGEESQFDTRNPRP